MLRVVADVALREGLANCVDGAPDVFELEDDDRVRVLKFHISEADSMYLEYAVRSCPVSALTVERD